MHLVLDVALAGIGIRVESATDAIPVFDQDVVVPTDCDEEEHDLHIVENVDPLLSLGSLPADVEHAVCKIPQLEYGFCYAGRP